MSHSFQMEVLCQELAIIMVSYCWPLFLWIVIQHFGLECTLCIQMYTNLNSRHFRVIYIWTLPSIWATIQIWKSCHMKSIAQTPKHWYAKREQTYKAQIYQSTNTKHQHHNTLIWIHNIVPHYAKWNIFANCNIAIMVSDNDNANWISLWR